MISKQPAGRARGVRATADDAEEPERLAALLEAVPCALLLLDRRGAIAWLDRAAEELLGYDRDELMDRPAEVLVPERLRRRGARAGTLYGPARRLLGRGSELRLLRKDGREVSVEIGSSPVETSEGSFVLLAVVDTSRRARAEAELSRRIERLEERVGERTRLYSSTRAALVRGKIAAEEASREKTALLRDIGHEIRTRLNAVIGLTELVLDSELSEEQRGYLDAVSGSGESLLALLDEVLELSLIEAGGVRVACLPFEHAAWLEASLAPLALEAKGKGVELTWRVLERVPERLNGDPERLRQVLLVLVRGAVERSAPRGEVTVEVKLGGARGGAARVLCYSVADTGKGVGPEPAPLGLAIVERLVGLMGGRVWAEREERGSIFHFTVGLTVAEEQPRARQHLADLGMGPPEERVPRPPLDILLVEDSPVNRQVAVGLLSRLGHRVTAAEDGAEALERWRDGGFDLVLMDVRMPRMDGLDATRAIRAHEREHGGHTPIVAMTAQALSGDRERCLRAGMDDYVDKPIHRDALVEAIARVVGTERSAIAR